MHTNSKNMNDSSDQLYEPEESNETWISMVSSSAFLSKLWQMLNDQKEMVFKLATFSLRVP